MEVPREILCAESRKTSIAQVVGLLPGAAADVPGGGAGGIELVGLSLRMYWLRGQGFFFGGLGFGGLGLRVEGSVVSGFGLFLLACSGR